jgi:hypothetical protein
MDHQQPTGPPPTPLQRAQRRRRRLWLAVAAAVVLVGVPLGLAIASGLAERSEQPPVLDDAAGGGGPADAPGADPDADGDTDADTEPDGDTDPDADPGADPGAGPDADPDADPDTDPDAGSDTDPGAGPDTDPGADPDAELTAPDLDGLSGVDAVYGQLLVDVDASEQVMLDFQDDLAAAFVEADSVEDAADSVRSAARDSRADLLEVRDRLSGGLDDVGAERVRSVYVDHLDAWANYMAAVAEDPLTLTQPDDAGYNVAINATAVEFERALVTELPPTIDAEVERFAQGILDRGFRGFGQADV